MRRLLLAGAGGLAREVLDLLPRLPDVEAAGLLDDDPATWGTTVGGVPVLGGIEQAKHHEEHGLVLCAGTGLARRAIWSRLHAAGVTGERLVTLVAPDVHLPASCRLGAGTIVLSGTVLTSHVTVGEHVVVMPHVTLTHDDVVEDFVTLCSGVRLGGRVHVREGAYVAMGAAVRENVEIGRASVLGMGSVLLEPLPAGETWVGVPARPLARAEAPGARSRSWR
jgi:sugar O-acyltransferase (sialic acid O-acetyltransferase NeuD family)